MDFLNHEEGTDSWYRNFSNLVRIYAVCLPRRDKFSVVLLNSAFFNRNHGRHFESESYMICYHAKCLGLAFMLCKNCVNKVLPSGDTAI
jgi:hypothetical protein